MMIVNGRRLFLVLVLVLTAITANAQPTITICDDAGQPGVASGELLEGVLSATLGDNEFSELGTLPGPLPNLIALDFTVTSEIPFTEVLIRVGTFDGEDSSNDIVLTEGFVIADFCTGLGVTGALLQTETPISSASVEINIERPTTALIIDVTTVLTEGDQFGFLSYVVEVMPPTPSPTAAPAAGDTMAPTASPTGSPTASPTAMPVTTPTTVAPTAAPVVVEIPTTVAPTAAPVVVDTPTTTAPTVMPVPAPVISVPVDGSPAITGFTLIDTTTLTRFPIVNGGSITVPADSGYSVIAETMGDIESVSFGLDEDDDFSTERVAPYTLCGDQSGSAFSDCDEFSFDTPISVTASIDGVAGSAQTVMFTLVEGADPATLPLRVTSIQLVEAETGASQEIVDGATLSISGSSGYSIEALAQGEVGSIVFDYNGVSAFNTENLARWFVCRNNGDTIFPCPDLVVGSGFLCTATPFTEDGGNGEAGEGISVTFNLA